MSGSKVFSLQAVLAQMDKRTAEDIVTHPFIQWTKNGDMSPRDKLVTWLPSITVFAMNFKDYNNIVLKYPAKEAKEDPLKAAINEHATEDGTHWRWLMTDMETLESNITLDAVSFFKTFWNKNVQIQRRVFYDLVALAHEAQNPILRYCLMTAFEKLGNVVISAMAALGTQFAAETGKELLFVGQTHVDHENGHLQFSPNQIDEEEFWNQEVDEATFKEALRIVNRVFDINVERIHGYLTFTGEGKKNNIYWKTRSNA